MTAAYPKDDTLDRAISAVNLPDLLNAVCPTEQTARLSREAGGCICDPRPGRGEKNPSFNVSPPKKGRWLWVRYGGGGQGGRDEGGNAYHLLLSLGYTPKDAARFLIDFTGIVPGRGVRHTPPPVRRRDPLDELRAEVALWKTVEKGKTARFGPAVAARGFTPEHAAAFHLADEGGDLFFEVRDPTGRLLAIKARRATEQGGRYYYATKDHGSPPWCSPEAGGPILMVEGELNALSAHLARPDLQVIGLTGTGGKFDPAWVKDRDVYVYGDADPDGRGLRARDRNADLVRRAGGRATELPALEWPRDFNDVLLEEGGGVEALARILGELMGAAPPPEPEDLDVGPVSVWEERGAYWGAGRSAKADPVQITNWVFEPEARLVWPDGRRGTRGLFTTTDRRQVRLDLESNCWNSRAELLQVIGPHDLLILPASNADVARLRAHLLHVEQQADLPVIRGVESYGEHVLDGRRLAVYSDAVLAAEGELETPPAFFAGPSGLAPEIHAAPPGTRPGEREAALVAARASLGLINADAALAIACKAASALLAPRLTAHYGHRMPFCTVTGERESGKSSYAELWLRLTTGRTTRTVKARDLRSEFQYDVWLSGQNDLLAILDEYHPDHLEDALLKGHYDLTVKRRGTGVGAHQTAYHRNSPLLILGQHNVTDPATRSRTVVYGTLPSERGDATAYFAVHAAPLEVLARPLKLAALALDDATLATWFDECRALAADVLGPREPRLLVALTDLAVGARFLNWALNLGVPASRVRELLAAGVHNTLEGEQGGAGQKKSMEIFLEQLGFAVKQLRTEQWADYLAVPARDASGESVLIRPTACVQLVERFFRDKAAIRDGAAFNTQAKDLDWIDVAPKGQFKAKGHPNPLRGVVLRFDWAPERCDLDAIRDVTFALIEGLEGPDDE